MQKEGIFLRGNGLAFELHTELFPAGEDLLLLLLELAVQLEELGVRGMSRISELLLQSTQLGIDGFAALLLCLQLTLKGTALLSCLLLALVVLRSRRRLGSLRLPLHGYGSSWVADRSAVLTVTLL